jgi:hypothetical protein
LSDLSPLQLTLTAATNLRQNCHCSKKALVSRNRPIQGEISRTSSRVERS